MSVAAGILWILLIVHTGLCVYYCVSIERQYRDLKRKLDGR